MDVLSGDVMSICEGMVGRGELDFVSGVVISVVGSIKSFVLFYSIDEGFVRLPVVCRGTVNGARSEVGEE